MSVMTVIEPVEAMLPPASSLALELPTGLDFDTWQRIGRELAAREKVLNWWIGDWWAFGEHRYGDRAKAVADGMFSLSFSTLANSASVCRAIKGSRRREVVSWSHHVEVAPLARQSAEAAEMLLDRAEREKMSVGAVRAAVRVLQGRTVGEALTARDDDPDHYEVLSMARAWNRSHIRNRETFMELAVVARNQGFEDVDP